jgi:regulator of sirC expression with transglutaminase-like and TPR domain
MSSAHTLPSEKELQAMIYLLDDSDQEVVQEVSQALLLRGPGIVPFLESAWIGDLPLMVRERIEELIHKIQWGQCRNALLEWNQGDHEDLLTALIWIARIRYPDLDESEVRNRLETLRIEIWMEMNSCMTALEKVRVINHVLFKIHGFRGNTANYNDPQNSCLNKVLESRKGNPIVLCCLYMWLAAKMDMPVVGVNLPQHFILAYLDADSDLIHPNKALFYINAFNKGMVFGEKEIERFLELIHLPANPRYFRPCTHHDIVIRVLNNLIHGYSESGKQEAAKELVDLRDIMVEQNPWIRSNSMDSDDPSSDGDMRHSKGDSDSYEPDDPNDEGNLG